jgi:hypothetical protein
LPIDPILQRRLTELPAQPFWFLLTWISIGWYALLVFYVGWKGFWDIRRMIAGLKKRNAS